MEISENAKKLYAYLIKNGCKWENECIEYLHPKPIYSRDNADEYFNYLSKLYGTDQTNHFTGEIIKGLGYENSYEHEISLLYQELRKNGLAGEKNNGYNCYAFYAIKK
jgi:hypothetical protein